MGWASLAVTGGSALTNWYMKRRAQKKAERQQQEAQAGATGAATGMEEAGTSLIKSGQQSTQQGMGAMQEGLDTLQQPGDYWSRLLGGNRASMAQATAAPRGAITDVYSGAERGLERSGVRGAQRDVAKSELNRERAGKVAGLTTGVQPAAAEAMTNIGTQRANIGNMMAGVGGQETSSGAYLRGGGGNIFANMFGQQSRNAQFQQQLNQQSGSAWGKMFFDTLSGWAQNKWGGRKSQPNSGGFSGWV